MTMQRLLPQERITVTERASEIFYRWLDAVRTSLDTLSDSVATLRSDLDGLPDIPAAGRELLTANRTYYVRQDGSDSNTGLSNTAAGAFLTIQKAVDVSASLDLSIYSITINVAPGTWTAPVVLKRTVGSGTVNIRGDTTTPSNVLMAMTSNTAFSTTVAIGYDIRGFKITTTTSGHAFLANGGSSQFTIGNIEFGACAGVHVFALGTGSRIAIATGNTISGGGTYHVLADESSSISFSDNLTHTLTGTPNFSVTFAGSRRVSMIKMFNPTFVGAATGQQYLVQSNSLLDTSVAATLPGSVAGATSTGGQFV